MEDRNSVINSWTKGVGVETLYTLLSSAHLELQRAHLILQSNLRKEQRTRKHLEEKVRYLNSIILSQKSKTNILINPINSSLSQQLEACKEREGKLLEQLQELNDQNELLEFRVLELEQCTGVGSEHTLAKGKDKTKGGICLIFTSYLLDRMSRKNKKDQDSVIWIALFTIEIFRFPNHAKV
ncbi:hypothetical protein M8J77_020388 [Diaphorina citri]|nr:hypothetical protein M8J77_020388 [Diaphorina citri]